MKSIIIVVWMCCFLLAMAVRDTYIVHMDKSDMPKVYSSNTHWYSSVVESSNILYSYHNALEGFSVALLSPKQLETLKQTPGFISAYRDRTTKLDTTQSYTFLSLNHSHGLWPASDYAQNVVVGVIDSGVIPESQSFNDHGMTTQPPPNWKGKCHNSSMCNSKLIGASYFNKGLVAAQGINAENSVRDTTGHGTHTASTIAGNYVNGTSYFGYAKGTARGIAPRAKIAIYKVAGYQEVYNSDILAGLDQAIADGVDVISISMGMERVPLYEDPVAIAAFSALEKGVLVSASAGNAGPSQGTLHNGIPWVLTVGAANPGRVFRGTLILGNGKRISGETLFPESSTVTDLRLIYHDNISACESSQLLSSGAERASIVICNSSDIMDLSQQIQQVLLSGVYLAIFISTNPPDPLQLKICPGIVISPEDGESVIQYARETQSASATIKFGQTYLGTKGASTVASYSSRGPSLECPWVLKPDVVAPGTSILAAWIPDKPVVNIGPNLVLNSEYNLMTGTSMACPHASGVVALLRNAHPEWTPSAIRSALMTTANPLDNTGNPIQEENGQVASPLAIGSGFIDPNRALDPGLVYDATPQDYVNLLCSMNFTQSQIITITRSKAYNCSSTPSSHYQDLNYPSFVAFYPNNNNATFHTKFQRVVTYVGDGPAVYTARLTSSNATSITVSPHRLVFKNKYDKHKFTLTLFKSPIQNEYHVDSGALEWVEETGRHVVRTPFVMLPSN